MSEKKDVQPLDTRQLRNALGKFVTGITIVTALGQDGVPIGLTVNSFNSVSLEPPLVLWSLGQRSALLADFQAAPYYVVNVLSADQESLSNIFASAGDRFANVVWQPGLGGAPILADCLASFEVRNTQQVAGGDHLIFIGQVERYQQSGDGKPLLFHAGNYARLA